MNRVRAAWRNRVPQLRACLHRVGARIKSFGTPFCFLTVLQIVWVALLLRFGADIAPSWTDWFGGYVLLTGTLLLVAALPEKKWLRCALLCTEGVVLSLLFVCEYHLLTAHGLPITRGVMRQCLDPSRAGAALGLLCGDITLANCMQAVLILCAIALFSWALPYAKRGLSHPYARMLLLAGFVLCYVSVRAVRVCRADLYDIDNTVRTYQQSDMVSRFFLATRGAIQTQRAYSTMAERIRGNSPVVLSARPERKPHNVVVIVGESLRRQDMHCYGYPLETTPHIDSMVQQGHITLYDDVVTCAANTISSLRLVLTIRQESDDELPASDKSWNETSTLPIAFSEAGYKSYWCSNQEVSGAWVEEVAIIASTADTVAYTDQIDVSQSRLWQAGKDKYDQKVLPLLRDYTELCGKNGSLLSVVHLMGNHPNFEDRYPEPYERFTHRDVLRHEPGLSTYQARRSAYYMNSILYNDHIVNEIIKRYSRTSSIVLYLSDHALTRYDNPATPDQSAVGVSKYSLQIPFMVYMSEQFKQENPDIVRIVQEARFRPFMTDYFTNSLLQLMGITTPYGNPGRELWSDGYRPAASRVIEQFGQTATFAPKHPDKL